MQMRYNAAVTAVFKNYANQQEMLRELFDSEGNIRPFNEFLKAVKPIAETFNKNYLRTEYNFAKASARAAMEWQDYEQRGGKITYWTQGDGRVRDKHKVLHGTTKAVGDQFWNLYYPPIQGDWGCRCYTRWAPADTPDVEPKGYPELKPGGGGNVGKTGIIFGPSSSYYKVVQNIPDALRFFGQKLPIDKDKILFNSELYQTLLKDKNYKLLHTDNLNGGFVFTDVNALKKEIEELLPVGITLSGRGDTVMIRKVINVSGFKNPDLEVNGLLAEVKTNITPSFSAIDQALRTKQAKNIVLNITSDIEPDVLEKAIYNRVRQNKNILTLTILYKDKIYELGRLEIINQTFWGKIK